jgi:hypothetical protein
MRHDDDSELPADQAAAGRASPVPQSGHLHVLCGFVAVDRLLLSRKF